MKDQFFNQQSFETWLRVEDPVPHLLATLWIIIASLWANTLLISSLVFLATILLILPYKPITSLLRLIWAMKWMILLLSGILILYSYPIIAWKKILITILRLLSLTISFTTFFAVTDPNSIGESLEQLKVPKLIARGIALTFAILDSTLQELKELKLIIQLKGNEFQGKNPFELVSSYSKLLIPAYVKSVIRSQSLAIALEVKGWTPTIQKQNYHTYIWTLNSWYVTMIWIITTGFIIFLKYFT